MSSTRQQMTKLTRTTALAAVAIAVAACGAGPSAAPTEADIDGSTGLGALRLSLAVPDEVLAGTSLSVVLTLTNVGVQPVTFVYGGYQGEVFFDVVAADLDGNEVWSRLHGRTLPRIATSRILAPGEVIQLLESWNLTDNMGKPLPRGSYRISAKVLSVEPSELRAAAQTVSVVTIAR